MRSQPAISTIILEELRVFRFVLRLDKSCANPSSITIRDSTVVSIPACRVGDPGSIPGLGVFYFLSFHLKIYSLAQLSIIRINILDSGYLQFLIS